MFSRRNWLLRCSIIINVTLILYLCSYVMIENSNNVNTGISFFMQDQQKSVLKEQLMKFGDVFTKNDHVLAIQEKNSQNALFSNIEISPFRSLVRDLHEEIQSSPTQQRDVEAISEGDIHSNIATGNFKADRNIYINNTSIDGNIVRVDEKDFTDRLHKILKCYNRPYEAQTVQRGDFWVLQNYIRAEHAELKCYESITYTTHADYTFLENIIPLLERWMAPVSIAMHAPGSDFQPTLDSIRYLRDCLPQSNLVRQFSTFHMYFSTKHIPKRLPKINELLKISYNCTLPAPFANVTSSHLYKTQKKLLYPVNVGRNIARETAITHFILASDIELYPNPGLVNKFLEMVARNETYVHRKAPRVFPLSIFEVEISAIVPRNKTELQELLGSGKAIPFHKHICANCHNMPKSKEWISANETEELSVFHTAKRTGNFAYWEPIYIGTHADPYYDERLCWEGKRDKMTQGYALCVLDYEFHILDNAFLVHKPGIKIWKKDNSLAMLAAKTNQIISKIIYPELKIMYGLRKGCAV